MHCFCYIYFYFVLHVRRSVNIHIDGFIFCRIYRPAYKFGFYFKIVEKGLGCSFRGFIMVRFLSYNCITFLRDWIYSLVICVTDIIDLLLLPLQLAAGPGWGVVDR